MPVDGSSEGAVRIGVGREMFGGGMFGGGGFGMAMPGGGGAGQFVQKFKVYPPSFMESDRPQVEEGDKIIMPTSCLEMLARLRISYDRGSVGKLISTRQLLTPCVGGGPGSVDSPRRRGAKQHRQLCRTDHGPSPLCSAWFEYRTG